MVQVGKGGADEGWHFKQTPMMKSWRGERNLICSPGEEVTSCGFGEKRINWGKAHQLHWGPAPDTLWGSGERKCMCVIPPGCVNPPRPNALLSRARGCSHYRALFR